MVSAKLPTFRHAVSKHSNEKKLIFLNGNNSVLCNTNLQNVHSK